MGVFWPDEGISGRESGRGVPLGESPETIGVSGECVTEGGGRDEEITDGGKDGDKTLASAG